jgi:hypothetical protein
MLLHVATAVFNLVALEQQVLTVGCPAKPYAIIYNVPCGNKVLEPALSIALEGAGDAFAIANITWKTPGLR